MISLRDDAAASELADDFSELMAGEIAITTRSKELGSGLAAKVMATRVWADQPLSALGAELVELRREGVSAEDAFTAAAVAIELIAPRYCRARGLL